MAYATNAEVASEFKNITFSATSSITTTEIDRFIEESEAKMNALVGKKYLVPIAIGASPESFKILRRISIHMTADRVRGILQIKNQNPANIKQSVKDEPIMLMVMKDMENIQNGKFPLPDATLVSSNDGFMSLSVDTCDAEIRFQRDVDQW